MLSKVNFKEDERYFFISGLIKAGEVRLLNEGDYLDMIELPIKNYFNTLIEKGYRLHNENEMIGFEKIYEWEMWHLKKMVLSYLDNSIARYLFLHHDLSNIKILLKTRYLLKKDSMDMNSSSFINSGIYEPKAFYQAIFEHDYSMIADPEIIDFIKSFEIYEKEETAEQNFDEKVDKFYYGLMLQKFKKSNYPIIHDILIKKIFLTNLKNFLRSRILNSPPEEFDDNYIEKDEFSLEFYRELWEVDLANIALKLSSHPFFGELNSIIQEYLKTRDISIIEKEFENLLTTYVKEETKYLISDLAVVYSYIYAKEIELKNLKLIYIAKINNLPESEMKKFLRKSYV